MRYFTLAGIMVLICLYWFASLGDKVARVTFFWVSSSLGSLCLGVLQLNLSWKLALLFYSPARRLVSEAITAPTGSGVSVCSGQVVVRKQASIKPASQLVSSCTSSALAPAPAASVPPLSAQPDFQALWLWWRWLLIASRPALFCLFAITTTGQCCLHELGKGDWE